MFGKRFEKELTLVESALMSEEGEKTIREFLKPYVESAVKEYKTEHTEGSVTDAELEKAGWTHLHLALKKYKGRAELMQKGKNDVFYFSTYFNWYIRQGILDYINSQKN